MGEKYSHFFIILLLYMVVINIVTMNVITRNKSSTLCTTVENYSSACWRVNELYPIGKSMEIPTWATLILAACLICGESLPRSNSNTLSNAIDHHSSSSKLDHHPSSLNFNRNLDYYSEDGGLRTTNNVDDDVTTSSSNSVRESNSGATSDRDIESQVVKSDNNNNNKLDDSVNEEEEEEADPALNQIFDFHKKPVEDTSYNLKAGRAINIFPRYGSLTLTLKVMPSQFSNTWLFRERTSEILKAGSYWEKHDDKVKGGHAASSSSYGSFDEHYLIDFCDKPNDLLAAYFDHFEIEGIPEPHKAFTSFLSTKRKARFLGIHSSYLTQDGFSFVLVRLFKTNSKTTLDGELDLSSEFLNATNRIRVGSSESAHQFMDAFGSHVLVEYSLGDVIYQVFIFGPRTYSELKNTFALSYQELTNNNTAKFKDPDSTLSTIREFFTPYLAVQVGVVQMASGDPKFDEISEQLNKKYFFLRSYQSIFQILNDKNIEAKVTNLKGKVITGIKMVKITRAMSNTPERYWLSIILDNCLALFYTTM